MAESHDDDLSPHPDPGRGEPNRVGPGSGVRRRAGGRTPDVDHDTALAELRSDMSIEDLRLDRREREAARQELLPAAVVAASIGRVVTIGLSSGVSITGEVVEVGRDYICLEAPTRTTWLRHTDIVVVHTTIDPADLPTGGALLDSGLIDVLHDLLAVEVDLIVVVRGGSQISGRPLGVGRSVTITDGNGYTIVSVDDVLSVSRSRTARGTTLSSDVGADRTSGRQT